MSLAPRLQPTALAHAILGRDRAALSQGITLVESTRPADQQQAQALVATLLPHAGQSLRLGITGTPGVGKSTFIEAFGLRLIDAGHRVAVLAIDPSSGRTGGSILGDKTRMELLARQGAAFIRPSPSSGALGGVGRATRESILLCEAAGYDRVVVETVGVGQSETLVRSMVDAFLLLVQPGGGDELQGIKRGIMEMADFVLINKADGELLPAARQAQQDYRNALHLLPSLPSGWAVPAEMISATSGAGLEQLLERLAAYQSHITANGFLQSQRAVQLLAWFEQALESGLLAALQASPQADLAQARAAVLAQKMSPSAAAADVLARFLGKSL